MSGNITSRGAGYVQYECVSTNNANGELVCQLGIGFSNPDIGGNRINARLVDDLFWKPWGDCYDNLPDNTYNRWHSRKTTLDGKTLTADYRNSGDDPHYADVILSHGQPGRASAPFVLPHLEDLRKCGMLKACHGSISPYTGEPW